MFRALVRACETLATELLCNRANRELRELIAGEAMTPSDVRSVALGFLASIAVLASDGEDVLELDWSALVDVVNSASTDETTPRSAALAELEGALSSESDRALLVSCAVSEGSVRAVLDGIDPVIHALRPRARPSNVGADFVASLAAIYGADVGIEGGERLWVRAKPICTFAARDPATEEILERVIDPLFERAPDSANGGWPVRGVRVVDPSCGDGAMLLAVVRRLRDWLAGHHGRLDDRSVERMLVAVVDQSVRGASRSRRSVALTRLALWLELGRRLDAEALVRCVSWMKPGQSARSIIGDDRPRVVVVDASASHDRALDDAVGVSTDQTLVAAVVKSSLVNEPAFRPLRKRVTSACVVSQPLVEPRASREDRRTANSVLYAVRSDASLEGSEARWAWRVPGLDWVAGSLFEALSLEARLDEVLSSYTREVAKRENRTIVRFEPASARSKFTQVIEVDRALCERPEHVGIADRSWSADSLRALLASSLVRWFAWALANNRGVAPRDLSPLALICPRAPSYERMIALANLGRTMLVDDERAWRSALDEAVFEMFYVTQPHEALVRRWASNEGALSVLDRAEPVVAPPLDRAPVSVKPEADSPSSPRYELREERAIALQNKGSHDGDTRRSRPTEQGPRAVGRGSESMLKGRSDDGRAATVPGAKRNAPLPEGDAEREAWAILRAAGGEGLAFGALVRRARAHEEDEIREAIAGLVAGAWVVVDGEGDEAIVKPIGNTVFRARR